MYVFELPNPNKIYTFSLNWWPQRSVGLLDNNFVPKSITPYPLVSYCCRRARKSSLIFTNNCGGKHCESSPWFHSPELRKRCFKFNSSKVSMLIGSSILDKKVDWRRYIIKSRFGKDIYTFSIPNRPLKFCMQVIPGTANFQILESLFGWWYLENNCHLHFRVFEILK